MKSLAIWGLPREAKFLDQSPWWEQAVEDVIRGHLAEPRDLSGIDLVGTPVLAIYHTSAARARCFDRYVTASRGLATGAAQACAQRGESS